MKEDKSVDDNVEIVDEEKLPETVEVSTEEKKEEETPSFVSADEFEKFKNRAEYQNRKLDKALKTWQQHLDQLGQPQATQPTVSADHSGKKEITDFTEREIEEITPAEIDKVANQNWQLAVDLRTAKVIRNKEIRQQQQQSQTQKLSVLEEAKNEVRQAYPEIDNGDSDVSKAYIQVLNSDPGLLQNPYGPIVAMQRMEKQFGIRPKQVRETFNNEVDLEVQRRQRIGAGSLPSGSIPNNDRVVLTQEQVNSAKQNNVPLAQFAKMYKLGARDFKEGVTVDE